MRDKHSIACQAGPTGHMAFHPWILDKLINQDEMMYFSSKRGRKTQILIRKCSLYRELFEKILLFSPGSLWDCLVTLPARTFHFLSLLKLFRWWWCLEVLRVGIHQGQAGSSRVNIHGLYLQSSARNYPNKEFLILWVTQRKALGDGREGTSKMKIEKWSTEVKLIFGKTKDLQG